MRNKNNYKLPVALIASLVIVACTDTSETAGTTGGGQGTAGSLATMTVLQNELHILHNNRISSFDITSDVLNPQEVGVSYLSMGTAETLSPFGSEYVLVGTSNGVVIQKYKSDTTAGSARFEHVNSVPHLVARDPVIAKDTRAFFTTRDGNDDFSAREDVVGMIDISALENATIIYRYADLKEPIGLGWWQEALYVCDREEGLTKFTIEEVNLADTNQLDENNTLIIQDTFGPGLVRQELNGFFPCSDVIPQGDFLILTGESGVTQLKMGQSGMAVVSTIESQ